MLSRFFTRREQLVLLFLALAIVVGSFSLYVYHRPNTTDVVAPASVIAVPEPNERTHQPAPVTPTRQEPTATPQSASEPPGAVVAIQGGVRRPGVYELNVTQRVEDLIRVAGGTVASADMSDINLAARLVDGTTLTIPERDVAADGEPRILTNERQAAVWNPPVYTISGLRERFEKGDVVVESGTERRAAGYRGAADGLIDINTASQSELESLPGIGPKLAEAIIRYRELAPFRSIEDLQQVNGIGPGRFEAVRDLIAVR